MATAQPNIVIIMADFMSALALPMYGNTTIRAPHLQRLGEEGVVFENAYCNAPCRRIEGARVSTAGAMQRRLSPTASTHLVSRMRSSTDPTSGAI